MSRVDRPVAQIKSLMESGTIIWKASGLALLLFLGFSAGSRLFLLSAACVEAGLKVSSSDFCISPATAGCGLDGPAAAA